MPLDPANNLAETELTASVSDTATTLPVADASVFPDADTEGAFNVLVWDANANINPSDAPDTEFVRVTSVDTTADELTVQRGQEDTPASAKASGSTVTDTWSVKDRDDIESGIAAKADDPHGSESHSSEVVHEGEDAAFGDTTHDSVSAEEANRIQFVTPDQNRSIQDAVDSLPEEGGTVVLSEGVWEEDATVEAGTDEHRTIVALPDNVTLRGQGRSTVIKLADDQDDDFSNQVIANEDLSVGGEGEANNEGLVIRDLVVDANRDGNFADEEFNRQWEGIDLVETQHCHIENVHVKNAAGDGIDLDACSYTTVTDSLLVDCAGSGVHQSGFIGNKIIDNRAIDCGHLDGRYGFDVFSTADLDDSVSSEDDSRSIVNANYAIDCFVGIGAIRGRAIISNNYIEGSDTDGIRVTSFGDSAPFFGDVRGNTVENAGRAGIRINENAEVSVESNVIDAPERMGIEVWDGTKAVVRDNSVHDAGEHGIETKGGGPTLIDNEIKACNDDGIRLNGDSNSSCEVRGNTLRNNRWGVLATGGSAHEIISNSASPSDSRAGFEVRVDACIIKSNVIKDTPADAVVTDGDDRPEDHGGVVSENTARDTGGTFSISAEDIDRNNEEIST